MKKKNLISAAMITMALTAVPSVVHAEEADEIPLGAEPSAIEESNAAEFVPGQAPTLPEAEAEYNAAQVATGEAATECQDAKESLGAAENDYQDTVDRANQTEDDAKAKEEAAKDAFEHVADDAEQAVADVYAEIDSAEAEADQAKGALIEAEETETIFQKMQRRAEENYPNRWRFEHAYVD